MLVDITHRSQEPELMDDFGMEGALLEKTLKDIAKLNRWLGGNAITLQGVKKIVASLPKDQTYTLVDIGCGNGDMLRVVAVWARANGYQLVLKGIDANAFTIKNAQELSESYPEISYECLDIFTEEYAKQQYDIMLCALTLHHFTTPEIKAIIKLFRAQAKVGIVINDLQRSRWAYYAFQCICRLWIRNPMARYDGAISILRGFTKQELVALSKSFEPTKRQKIQWKWAFRYQWIVQF